MKTTYKSLYEFLNRPAGKVLGNKIYLLALKEGIPISHHYVKNKKYEGHVNSYPIEFLEKAFSPPPSFPKDNVVLSLSGGLDSSTLLLKCLYNYKNVVAVSFDYGQKHKIELVKAQQLVEYLTTKGFKLTHKIIRLDGLSELLSSTLVEGGNEVPEGHYAEDNMKETVVPNRNKIFSSIIQAIALSISNQTKQTCDIALGIHSGDHCFSKNTQILTPTGLKNILDLKKGDEIFSFNLDKNDWERDKVIYIHEKDIVDNINLISTLSGNIELTDEHQVYRLKVSNFNPRSGYDKSIEKVKVKNLQEGDYLIQPTGLKGNDEPIKSINLYEIAKETSLKYENGLELNEEGDFMWLGSNHDKYKNNKIPKVVDAESFINMMAWYLAEGTSQKDSYKMKPNQKSSRYSASLSQSLKTNLDKVDLILKDLETSQLKGRYEFSKKTHNNIPKDMVLNFSNITAMILKEGGTHSNVKEIPSWLMDILIEDNNLRESFLYTIGIADGFNTENKYRGFCSISTKLMEQVITLTQLSGYHYTKYKTNPSYKTSYISYSRTHNRAALISLGGAKFTKINKITQIPYNDRVYDITVEKNHNFLAGEHGSILISNSIYPDCRQDFRDADDKAFRIGNWDSENVNYYTPYLDGDKFTILQDGENLCKELNLDFNEVYKRTNTSYKPVELYVTDPKSGSKYFKIFSDFKSGSSVERIEAFIKLGRPDPLEYADEVLGPIGWGHVVKYVQKILKSHKNEI